MYRLQRKETYVMPNILVNRSFPVYTFRWKDIAICEKKEPLEKAMKEMAGKENYRIIEDHITAKE